MKYKYINFGLIQEKKKTSVWDCRNNKTKELLGIVFWYGPWRCYVFETSDDVVFNHKCLVDIAGFIKTQMDLREKQKQEKLTR